MRVGVRARRACRRSQLLVAAAPANLRVSTQRPGRCGLGLEAQREAVTAHARGGSIVREFVEVESGKRQDRRQLEVALQANQLHPPRRQVGLARSNVEFTARLMEHGELAVSRLAIGLVLKT